MALIPPKRLRVGRVAELRVRLMGLRRRDHDKWHQASLEPLPSTPKICLHSPDHARLGEPAPILGSMAACVWHSP